MWGTPHWGPQTAWWMSQQTRLVTPAFGVTRTPLLLAKRLQSAATEVKPEANPIMGCEISADSSPGGPQTTSGQKTTVGLVADPFRRAVHTTSTACPNESVGECTSCRVRDALHVQNVTRLARSNQRTILKLIDDLAALRSEVTLLRKESEQLVLQVAALAQLAQVPQTGLAADRDPSASLEQVKLPSEQLPPVLPSQLPSMKLTCSAALNEATAEDKEKKGPISHDKIIEPIKISPSTDEPTAPSAGTTEATAPPSATVILCTPSESVRAPPEPNTADAGEESESLSDWERASSSVSPVPKMTSAPPSPSSSPNPPTSADRDPLPLSKSKSAIDSKSCAAAPVDPISQSSRTSPGADRDPCAPIEIGKREQTRPRKTSDSPLPSAHVHETSLVAASVENHF
jgi:hypothetical protein